MLEKFKKFEKPLKMFSLIFTIIIFILCLVPMFKVGIGQVGAEEGVKASIIELCFEEQIGDFKIKNSLVFTVLFIIILELIVMNFRAYKKYLITYTVFDALLSLVLFIVILAIKPHAFLIVNNELADQGKSVIIVGTMVLFIVFVLLKLALDIFVGINAFNILKEQAAVYYHNPDEEKPEDNRTIGEKVEDAVEMVMDSTQDAFLGERESFTTDIPATIEKPTGIRVVNKLQTRRNILRYLLGDRGSLIIGGFILLSLVIFIVFGIIF